MTEALLARCIDGEPRLAGLDATLGAVVGPACRVVAVRKLTNRVYRVSLTIDGRSLSLVAKRLRSPVAGRIQLALERWLPQAGLARAAPGLVGVSPDPGAHPAWHLYEDLGTRTLAHAAATPAAFERAVQLVATIHARFAQESTLAEWRIRGEDHGLGFYESSVRGAIDGVEAVIAGCDRRTVNVAGARRLRARLEGLSQKRAETAQMLAELGGPDTLLHGDLWPKNIAVVATGATQGVRLIDWDRVGPGSFSYDLSTLALRAPVAQRPTIVSLYRRAAAAHGVRLPADSDLRLLFANAECARLASMTVWIANEAVERRSRWAFERLVEIDGWLERAEAQCAG